MSSMKAILLVSHGSKSEAALEENHQLLDAIKSKLSSSKEKDEGAPIIEAAFLDINSPSIPQGIEQCVKKGASSIKVIPNFLNSGRHVLEHIPAIIEDIKPKYPDIPIELSTSIGRHPGMIELYVDLIMDKNSL